jgi:hypothetical protein
MINCQLSRRSLWLWIGIGVVVLGGIVTIQMARVVVYGMGTAKRLQMIAMALECYHEVNGCYPPQFLTNKQGQPAHSWRVLVLPYLSHENLYRRYRFDEPWDGPHNRLLAMEMPEEYRSPFLDSESTITQYVGISGSDTAWRGAIPLSRKGLRSTGNDAIIWLVEAANSDIHWMEPRDIPIEQASNGLVLRQI